MIHNINMKLLIVKKILIRSNAIKLPLTGIGVFTLAIKVYY